MEEGKGESWQVITRGFTKNCIAWPKESPAKLSSCAPLMCLVLLRVIDNCDILVIFVQNYFLIDDKLSTCRVFFFAFRAREHQISIK